MASMGLQDTILGLGKHETHSTVVRPTPYAKTPLSHRAS